MSNTFELILDLIERKNVMISDHGYDELAEDGIFVRDIMAGVAKAILVKNERHNYQERTSVTSSSCNCTPCNRATHGVSWNTKKCLGKC